jgi:hypothetical protein
MPAICPSVRCASSAGVCGGEGATVGAAAVGRFGPAGIGAAISGGAAAVVVTGVSAGLATVSSAQPKEIAVATLNHAIW